MATKVPFTYIGGHLISINAKLNDSYDTKFILDTGIGLNLLMSKSLTDETIYEILEGETFVGKRMSGQDVTCNLANVKSITIGDLHKENITFGLLDMKLPNELSEIMGFLSLNFFEQTPFTLDYPSHMLVFENEESLQQRADRGRSTQITLRRDGPSTDAFLDIRLPSGTLVHAEVDTGSDALILDDRYMTQLGVEGYPSVRKVEGRDETGQSYTRYFGKISGSISLAGHQDISQENPETMFQRIVRDALIGDAFLKSYAVTFDLIRSRMIFAKP